MWLGVVVGHREGLPDGKVVLGITDGIVAVGNTVGKCVERHAIGSCSYRLKLIPSIGSYAQS